MLRDSVAGCQGDRLFVHAAVRVCQLSLSIGLCQLPDRLCLSCTITQQSNIFQAIHTALHALYEAALSLVLW